MRRSTRRLSSQIFIAQTVILAVSIGIGFALFAVDERSHLDADYEARAAVIAETVAQMPTIQRCMTLDSAACATTEQSIALATAGRTGAAYVVLIDSHRIRHSHPDPALIGKPVSEPLVAVDGRTHLGIDSGATGVNANARAPLYSIDRRFIGEVSVGIRESSVSTALVQRLPSYGIWFAVMLGIGALASFGLAANLKRRTFGLELDEIVHLLQEREATLHGIREGVIAIDPDGRMTVVNDEAMRLLDLPPAVVGKSVTDIIEPGTIRDELVGTSESTDRLLVTADYTIVLNRIPVRLAGRPHGVVVTLQDRTALTALTSELDGIRSLTESMRAQQHEFANRLHAIAGLLELARPDEALEYVNEIRGTSASFDEALRTHIGPPQIIGLLLGKGAEANERGIDLQIAEQTFIDRDAPRIQALTTILGNLIDNAFDAVAGRPAPRIVRVAVSETTTAIRVEVADNGPGIPPDSRQDVFVDGFSTKHGVSVRPRGLGLALVHATAARLHGAVDVSEGPGATFTVVLPKGEVPAA